MIKGIFAVGLLTYYSTSYFLFKNAKQHQRKDVPSRQGVTPREEINQRRPLINCAHRCGCGDAFENTVPAAILAVTKNGAGMLEFDLHQTKDKVPILQHERALKRTCNHGRFTTDFNFKDLPPLHSQIDIPFILDSKGKLDIYQHQKSDSKKVNSLEELLTALDKVDKDRKVWLNLELKEFDEGFAQKTLELLKKHQREATTIWGHMGEKECQYLQSIAPEVKRYANHTEVMKLYLMYFTGILPFVKLNYQSLQMPLLTQSYKKMKSDQYKSDTHWKYKLNLSVLKFMLRTSKPLFKHLQDRGIHIMMWVPNTEEEYQQCLELFPLIDGIITDKPSTLNDFIGKNKEIIGKKSGDPFYHI